MKFLVVDSDKANVKYLRGALQSLGCQVTTCNYQEQAFLLLYDQKLEFDIVVADINMSYELGFKFLELVRTKMNLPTIVMCSAKDKEIISAGIDHGACEVAVKPLRIDDVRRFRQYAVTQRRKHLLEVGNSASNSEGLHGQENGLNQGMIDGRLYKDRLVWTEDLKALFDEAVHALGGKDVAVPRKIMKLMNVPNLTRENIASHLQKYRQYSDPNYVGGKRKRKVAQPMLVNRLNEQGPGVAHPNRRILSFEAPASAPDARNVLTQPLFGQTEGISKLSPGILNVQPYVPEPPMESVMRKGMAVPEVFGDSRGSTLPAQLSLELQVPSDGIRNVETPPALDRELKSFLEMDLWDLNFMFFGQYPPQDMSMIYGGPSNGLHNNHYPVGQSEKGNGDLSALNDWITNDPATDSLLIVDPEASNPMATQYPQNISGKAVIFDHANISGQQQQQQELRWSKRVHFQA